MIDGLEQFNIKPVRAGASGFNIGVCLVERSNAGRQASREASHHAAGHHCYFRRSEEHTRHYQGRGVKMNFFKRLFEPKIDHRSIIREEKIAQQVLEINRIVEDLQKKKTKDGLAEQNRNN